LALFESASGLLRRVSADRTLVFAVEDLHWVDRSACAAGEIQPIRARPALPAEVYAFADI
jgi:hypothetical protein